MVHFFQIPFDILKIILAMVYDIHSENVSHINYKVNYIDNPQKGQIRYKGYTSTNFLPYLLVCKTFRDILLYDYIDFFKEIDWENKQQSFEKIPWLALPYLNPLINYLKDFNNLKNIRLWIQINKVICKKYATTNYKHTVKYLKWKSFHCEDAFGRKVIHTLCKVLGLYHITFRIICPTYDSQYHRKYSGLSESTTCGGCEDCLILKTKKAGVIISDKFITVNPTANQYVKRIRKLLLSPTN